MRNLETIGRAVLLLVGCLPQPSTDETVRASLQQILERLDDMASKFDSALATLRQDVAKNGTVISSAKVALDGLAGMVFTLKANMAEQGVTAEQLSGLDELHQAIVANTDTLSKLVTSNTPSADPYTAVPVNTALPSGATEKPPAGDTTATAPAAAVPVQVVPPADPVTEAPESPEQGASPEQPAT